MSVQAIAIHLPQFHPIPENDEWWGKGFTEWTNVTKAKPLFKNHYQPHLPADLGFYDLRLADARLAQEALAKQYGITGFCYYHYWFNGRRLLEKPVEAKLANPKEDLPFMLCWANESWSRRWDGNEKEFLIEQQYSTEDDLAHIRYLIPFFQDKRYIRINDKPVIAIYKSIDIPHIKKTIHTWRTECSKVGIELYIARFENFGNAGSELVTKDGFDAAIDFQPFNTSLFDFIRHKKTTAKYTSKWFRSIWNSKVTKHIQPNKYRKNSNRLNGEFDYQEYVEFVKKLPVPTYKCYPGITPMWDNVARKKNGYFLFKNSTPEIYQSWLQHIVNTIERRNLDQNIIFINAWNEWAEGNHLEPCQKWGHEYLKVTHQIISSRNQLLS